MRPRHTEEIPLQKYVRTKIPGWGLVGGEGRGFIRKNPRGLQIRS